MSRADWRSPGTYVGLWTLDGPGLAWECLCRNAEYLREREELTLAAREGRLHHAEADAFARRWGVRFHED